MYPASQKLQQPKTVVEFSSVDTAAAASFSGGPRGPSCQASRDPAALGASDPLAKHDSEDPLLTVSASRGTIAVNPSSKNPSRVVLPVHASGEEATIQGSPSLLWPARFFPLWALSRRSACCEQTLLQA